MDEIIKAFNKMLEALQPDPTLWPFAINQLVAELRHLAGKPVQAPPAKLAGLIEKAKSSAGYGNAIAYLEKAMKPDGLDNNSSSSAAASSRQMGQAPRLTVGISHPVDANQVPIPAPRRQLTTSNTPVAASGPMPTVRSSISVASSSPVNRLASNVGNINSNANLLSRPLSSAPQSSSKPTLPTIASSASSGPSSSSVAAAASLSNIEKVKASLAANANKPIGKTVTDVVGKSAEDRFADACNLLNVNTKSLEQLQRITVKAKPGTGGINDTNEAKNLVDPILTSKVEDGGKRVVNETLEEEAARSQKAQSAEAFIQVVLRHYGFTKRTDVKHWLAKGKLLADNPNVRIQCDGSAAVAFYHLYKSKLFMRHIGIVEQGNSGHWFVVAAQTVEELQPGHKDFGKFVIDIWGANWRNLQSTVWGGLVVGSVGGSNEFKLRCAV